MTTLKKSNSAPQHVQYVRTADGGVRMHFEGLPRPLPIKAMKTSNSMSETPLPIAKSSVQRVTSDPVKLLTDSCMDLHCLKEPMEDIVRYSSDNASSLEDHDDTSSIDDNESVESSMISELESMTTSLNDVDDEDQLFISMSDICDFERMTSISDINLQEKLSSINDQRDYIPTKSSISDNEEIKTSNELNNSKVSNANDNEASKRITDVFKKYTPITTVNRYTEDDIDGRTNSEKDISKSFIGKRNSYEKNVLESSYTSIESTASSGLCWEEYIQSVEFSTAKDVIRLARPPRRNTKSLEIPESRDSIGAQDYRRSLGTPTSSRPSIGTPDNKQARRMRIKPFPNNFCSPEDDEPMKYTPTSGFYRTLSLDDAYDSEEYQVPTLDARERRDQSLISAHLPWKKKSKKTKSLPVPPTFADIEMSQNRPLQISDLQTPFHIRTRRRRNKPSVVDIQLEMERPGQIHLDTKGQKGQKNQPMKKKSNGHRKEETDSLSITALYHKTLRQQMKTAYENGKPIPLI